MKEIELRQYDPSVEKQVHQLLYPTTIFDNHNLQQFHITTSAVIKKLWKKQAVEHKQCCEKTD